MKTSFLTGLFLILSITTISAQKAETSLANLFNSYITIKNALTQDNSDLASKSADNFIKNISVVDYKVLSEGNINILKKQASEIADSRSIVKQRSAFKNLSENITVIAEQFPISDSSIYVQYCPMAEASWLSENKEIKNPYYGASMLNCGSVKRTITK